MLRLYGLCGGLLKGVQSYYVNSRTCVRVGNNMSDWFPVTVVLHQGCVKSPWLFGIDMDVIRMEDCLAEVLSH